MEPFLDPSCDPCCAACAADAPATLGGRERCFTLPPAADGGFDAADSRRPSAAAFDSVDPCRDWLFAAADPDSGCASSPIAVAGMGGGAAAPRAAGDRKSVV